MVNSEGETETVAVAAIVGSADDANGYALVPIVEVPAATTKNAVLTLRRSGWIGLRTVSIIVRIIPIVAPLPYVAAHVIQAKFVGFLGLDRVGRSAAITTIPRYFVGIVAAAVLIAFALVATASSILPFGFGGQAEFFSGEFV